MSTYPPSGTAAEEYELSPNTSLAGLSTSPRQSTSRQRKLTINPNQSSAALFGVGVPPTRPRGRRRTISNPVLNQVTEEEPGHAFLADDRGQTEEVELPDFGHILGFNEGDDQYTIAASMRSPWKRKLYLLMEEPSSGREAVFIHLLVTGAILFSAILTTLSTLPAFHTNPAAVKVLFGLDTTLVILFTVEYLARSLAHSDSWSQYYNWATSFFGILDLLSIAPYYIEVARQEDTSILFRFSILRTFRLLRVFRAFKYQNKMLLTIEVMYVAVRRSKDALIAITYFIILVLVLFSTLIYFAERGTWDSTLGEFVDPDGEVSLFDSIPQTAWYALVTMSTAGYGDVVPRTALGKILSVPLLLFGLLLIALPSFVLGRNFAIVYDAMMAVAGNPSKIATPRDSISDSSPPKGLTPVQEDSNIPLLPVAHWNGENRSRDRSPHPGTEPGPRMWAGDPNLHTPVIGGPGPRPPARDSRDLTNVKLAKNQAVLLEQIESLRRTIDQQGEMLSALMSTLALREGVELPQQARDKGKGKQVEEDSWT